MSRIEREAHITQESTTKCLVCDCTLQRPIIFIRRNEAFFFCEDIECLMTYLYEKRVEDVTHLAREIGSFSREGIESLVDRMEWLIRGAKDMDQIVDEVYQALHQDD
jgi:hypothetical protein